MKKQGWARTLTRLYAVVGGCTSRVCFRLKPAKQRVILHIGDKYTVALAVGN
nr:MAG TPA: hypothetical protein [Caudoviricetes sp.]